jgi:hypothetical protein
MGTSHKTEGYILASLRKHVLTPLTRAERIVEVEREEVEAERRAYVKFRERITGIETISNVDTESGPPARTTVVETPQRSGEHVRAAFRETVMSVDHYDEVYGETLEEHAATELSEGVGAILQPEVATPFTEWHKAMLISSVDSVVVGRRRFRDLLDDELSSINKNRAALTEIVNSCDGPTIPKWYRNEFENRLDEIAESRQERIQRRDIPSRIDGHDLCLYLYQDCEWTYPILTAVTRFRSAVS